jgi:hypothetical protein
MCGNWTKRRKRNHQSQIQMQMITQKEQLIRLNDILLPTQRIQVLVGMPGLATYTAI